MKSYYFFDFIKSATVYTVPLGLHCSPQTAYNEFLCYFARFGSANWNSFGWHTPKMWVLIPCVWFRLLTCLAAFARIGMSSGVPARRLHTKIAPTVAAGSAAAICVCFRAAACYTWLAASQLFSENPCVGVRMNEQRQ